MPLSKGENSRQVIVKGRADVSVEDLAECWRAICLHDLIEGKACVAERLVSGVGSESREIGVSALKECNEGMSLSGGNMDTRIHVHGVRGVGV